MGSVVCSLKPDSKKIIKKQAKPKKLQSFKKVEQRFYNIEVFLNPRSFWKPEVYSMLLQCLFSNFDVWKCTDFYKLRCSKCKLRHQLRCQRLGADLYTSKNSFFRYFRLCGCVLQIFRPKKFRNLEKIANLKKKLKNLRKFFSWKQRHFCKMVKDYADLSQNCFHRIFNLQR